MRYDDVQHRRLGTEQAMFKSSSPVPQAPSPSVAFCPELLSLLEEYDLLQERALLEGRLGIKKKSDLLYVDQIVIHASTLTPVCKAKLTKLVAAQKQPAPAAADNHPPSLAAPGTPMLADIKRIRIDAGAQRFVINVSARCSVKQACAIAESRMGSSSVAAARRIRTFALPDGCELDADDLVVDVVSEMMKDCEMLRAVFEAPMQKKAAPPRISSQGARMSCARCKHVACTCSGGYGSEAAVAGPAVRKGKKRLFQGYGKRIVLWDTRHNKRIAGGACPKAKNIDEYLVAHPWMRVWKRDDAQAPVTSSKQTHGGTNAVTPEASGVLAAPETGGKQKEKMPIMTSDIMTSEIHAADNEPDDVCVLCWEQPAVVAFQPCGHLCVCEACQDSSLATEGGSSRAGGHHAPGVEICPMCRCEISGALRVFRC